MRRNRALGWGGQRGYRKNAGWENCQKGIAPLAGPTPARRFLRTRFRVLKPRGPLPRKPADTFLDTFLVGQKSIDHPGHKWGICFLKWEAKKGSAGKAANPPAPTGHPPLHKGGFGGGHGIRGAQEKLPIPQSASQTAPFTQGGLLGGNG